MNQPGTTPTPAIVRAREMLTVAATMRDYGFPLVDILDEQQRLARLTDPHHQIRPATPADYDSGGAGPGHDQRLCEYPDCNLVGPMDLMHQVGGEAWYCPIHITMAPLEDTLEGYLGNALALVRLTRGRPNSQELRSIRLLLLRGVLECRRLIECAKYVDQTDDGLCPWDGLDEQEPPRPDVAVDLTSFELLP